MPLLNVYFAVLACAGILCPPNRGVFLTFALVTCSMLLFKKQKTFFMFLSSFSIYQLFVLNAVLILATLLSIHSSIDSKQPISVQLFFNNNIPSNFCTFGVSELKWIQTKFGIASRFILKQILHFQLSISICDVGSGYVLINYHAVEISSP